MLKYMKRLVMTGFLIMPLAAHAAICKQIYKDRPFRQAIIFSIAGHGGVRCNYSKHQINFHHSYQVYGPFAPISGPWEVSSETGLIYCRSNNAAECQFATQSYS